VDAGPQGHNYATAEELSSAMRELVASLRFAGFPALAQLLADLGSTGRLRITEEAWSGEIVFRAGQMVSARLANESGRAAVEGISIGLSDGDVYFKHETLDVDCEPLVEPAEMRGYLMRLSVVRERIAELIPSLHTIPTLVERAEPGPGQRPVTLGTAGPYVTPELISGRTLDQVAFDRGLGRTVREVAGLVEAGVVRLERPAAAV
jgi:hypothetical protein